VTQKIQTHTFAAFAPFEVSAAEIAVRERQLESEEERVDLLLLPLKRQSSFSPNFCPDCLQGLKVENHHDLENWRKSYVLFNDRKRDFLKDLSVLWRKKFCPPQDVQKKWP